MENEVEISDPASDPLACILNPSTAINNVQLVRDTSVSDTYQSPSVPRSLVLSQTTHKMVNILSRCDNSNYLPQSSDTVVLNHNHISRPMHSITPLVPTNMKKVHLISETVSIAAPKGLSNKSQATTSRNDDNTKQSTCPIKLVDMKKLLKEPPLENKETVSSIPYNVQTCSSPMSNQKVIKERTPKTQKPNLLVHLKGVNNKDIDQDSYPAVTISQVLDCLRVILPRTFVLSRLKPSDKVASLVIKYLKLDSNKIVENKVKVNLKIIIDAAKLEDKVFGSDLTHPYNKVGDGALSLALHRMFPERFCMSDVTNEKLKCLCVLLTQDVYFDGFNILRSKIQKFAQHQKEKSDEIVYATTVRIDANTITCDKFKSNKQTVVNPSKQRKTSTDSILQREIVNTSIVTSGGNRISDERKGNRNNLLNSRKVQKKTMSNKLQRKESVEKIRPNAPNVMTKRINNIPGKQVSNSDSKLDENNTVDMPLSPSDRHEKTGKSLKCDNKRANLTTNLNLIKSFLKLKEYSASHVLEREKVMKNLCKYLHINSGKSNLQKLRKMLLYLAQKKLTKKGTLENILNSSLQQNIISKEHKEDTLQGGCKVKSKSPKSKGVKLAVTPIKKKVDIKLELTPVVVLHDIVCRNIDQLLFMTAEKPKSKSSGFPPCFTQNSSLQKYSTDHVRMVTDKSYREFRQIVIKKYGEKVFFRLRYKKLSPGSAVFVKNFMYPSFGWLKGTISKMIGPLRYIVQLEDGESSWTCVPEQLRPIPERLREQRCVKPKQHFDL